MRQLLVAAESSWGSSEWLVCSGLPSTSSFTRCEDFVSGLERFCMEAGMSRSCCCTFFPARCTPQSCFAGTGLSPGHAVPGGSWKGCCREARRAAVSSAQKQCLMLTCRRQAWCLVAGQPEWCWFFLCIHRPLCLYSCSVSFFSLLLGNGFESNKLASQRLINS